MYILDKRVHPAPNTPVCLTQPQPGSAFIQMYLFTQANFYPSKPLCFRDKYALRHLSALKSVSVLSCGTCNYQRAENQGLFVKPKHP